MFEKILFNKILLLLLVFLLAGCVQEKVFVCPDGAEVIDSSDCFQQTSEDNSQADDALPVADEFGGEIKVTGVVDANPLGQFAQDAHKVNSAILNYELRRCTYTEQTIYRDIRRPMVSIHSLEGTPERNMPLMVVYENTDKFVETNYAPVTQLLLVNETNMNTGEIIFELDAETQGDIFIGHPEIASLGSTITKSPGIGTGWLGENYAYLTDKKYYLYDQNENLIFVDSNKILNKETPLKENEVSIDDFYNINFLPLCDSALDYIVADDYENDGKKQVPCKHAFKKFEIDNVKPKELLLIAVYYYPYSRVSFEQKYLLDPPSLWPLKEQQGGNISIKITATYPDKQTTELMQINLKIDLKEYDYDTGWDYCVPKNGEEENTE